MKGLFVVFHGFSAHSGISKKISYQCEAFRRNNIDMRLCYMELNHQGEHHRMVDGHSIHNFGSGLRAKIEKRICFADILRYVRDQGIEFLYIRHDFNASPATIRFVSQIRKMGVRIALEIPTYPYDNEFAQSSSIRKLKLQIDKLFRTRLASHVNHIVTFSSVQTIFGCPTICISNGIDFNQIPLKTPATNPHPEIRLLALANIHFWHGFDRVIEGLHNYYATRRTRRVVLRIAGDGVESLIQQYRHMVDEYNLGDYIQIIGPRSGEALDEQFNWADGGIASLARHRSGIESIKTLKNREYAARGLWFVYSEIDEDFETMPYILKASPDDSPLDIEALVRFHDALDCTPQQIRSSIEGSLSWSNQMKIVLEKLLQ